MGQNGTQSDGRVQPPRQTPPVGRPMPQNQTAQIYNQQLGGQIKRPRPVPTGNVSQGYSSPTNAKGVAQRPQASAKAPVSSVQNQALGGNQRRPSAAPQQTPSARVTPKATTAQNAAPTPKAVPNRSLYGKPAASAPAPRRKAVSARSSKSEDTRTIDRRKLAESRYDDEMPDGKRSIPAFIKAIVYIVAVFAVAGILAYYVVVFANDMYAFIKSDEAVEVVIPEYATVGEISEILGEAGVVKYPSLLNIYAKIKEIDKTYKFVAGTYVVNGMMNYDELFLAFVKTKTNEAVRITIPEGYTVDEIINLFVEKGIGTRERFIEVINTYDFDFPFVKALNMEELDGRTYRLEGYLYPDTYDFYLRSNEETVIYKLLSRFNVIYEEAFYEKATELGYSVDEIITLASMIEKEARYSQDYEMVSSVFHNRLNDPANYPRMESDATIMYAIQIRDGERKKELTGEDLKYDTPYNSYIYEGLPPGPIANPGYEAITCALWPAKTKYKYFVSDSYGNTYFSRTLSEHNAAVAKVRKAEAD